MPMVQQRTSFDRRDAVSLMVMLLSAAASIVYWCGFAGMAADTYNVFPDALNRY